MLKLSTFRLACVVAALAFSVNAHADSFASSASSASSASVGSVSDSLRGSSDSSTGGKKVADGTYRIIGIDTAPDRAGIARVTMQGADAQRVVLDLPQATFAQQNLSKGDLVLAQNRVYGIEFARNDTRKSFYLVLADEWYGELAARPVGV